MHSKKACVSNDDTKGTTHDGKAPPRMVPFYVPKFVVPGM